KVAMSCLAMPVANRSYRPACSPMPCTTAKVICASACGHARYARVVPSAEANEPWAVSALSRAKVAETSQDLQRLLLRFEQGRRVRADPAKRVCPLGTRWALRVQTEGRRIEEDALAFDLLDHRPFRQHVLEGLTVLQPPGSEVEEAEHG